MNLKLQKLKKRDCTKVKYSRLYNRLQSGLDGRLNKTLYNKL